LPFAFCDLNFELLFQDEQIKWQMVPQARDQMAKITYCRLPTAPRPSPPCGAIHDQIRVLAPESFSDVAGPANGRVSLEYLRQFLSRNLVPVNGFLLGVQQGRHVPNPFLTYIHELTANGAGLARIPIGNDAANQATFRSRFDLFQALLPASLPFRPAGTLAQAKVRCAKGRIPGQGYGVQFNRCGLLSFRASDQPLSSQSKVGTQASKQQIPDTEPSQRKYDPKKSKIHGRLLSSPN
jgi:hypothetical protein